MKKILLFLFITLYIPLNAHSFAHYPKNLEHVVKTLVKMPEAQDLMDQISREGKISVKLQKGAGFEAYWDPLRRLIFINPDRHRNEGQYLCSLLFEMHNASAAKEFSNLDLLARKRKLTRRQYVEKVEWIEHQNALKTCAILNKAIDKRIYPPSARWTILYNFQEHFKVQKMYGHSAYIARCYDRITS